MLSNPARNAALVSKTEFRFDLAHLRSLKEFSDLEPSGEQTVEWLIETHFFYTLDDVKAEADARVIDQVLVVTLPTAKVPLAMCVFKEMKIWH